ncbi:ricin-type beta-trefoil lectin domain protein [Actinosynnema sp. NPDC049800]
MKFARLLVTFVATVSALLVAPLSNAAQPDAQQTFYEIQSDTVTDDVWDQTNWAWNPDYPVIAHPRHGGDNQQWYWPGDGTIRNKQYGWCVTSIEGTLAGRDCGAYPNQEWDLSPRDNWRVWKVELRGTNLCVTHNGTYNALVLTRCEEDRVDQLWHLIER